MRIRLASRPSTRNPYSPCVTISGIPPTAVNTIGVPKAMASITLSVRVGRVIGLGSLLFDHPDVAEVDRITMALQLERTGGSGLVLAARGGAFA